LDEEDDEESRDDTLGFATQARAPVTQSLDNLTSAIRYKQSFAKEVQLGQHTAKMFSCYVDALTPSEFTFKSLPDVKIEDFKKTFDALPEPWVLDKRFSIHGYATHKHPVNPTGLDEEELAAHKTPLEAQKLSDLKTTIGAVQIVRSARSGRQQRSAGMGRRSSASARSGRQQRGASVSRRSSASAIGRIPNTYQISRRAGRPSPSTCACAWCGCKKEGEKEGR
jgi:hypothetical protein